LKKEGKFPTALAHKLTLEGVFGVQSPRAGVTEGEHQYVKHQNNINYASITSTDY
jgi:hypothetical protein